MLTVRSQAYKIKALLWKQWENFFPQHFDVEHRIFSVCCWGHLAYRGFLSRSISEQKEAEKDTALQFYLFFFQKYAPVKVYFP